MQKQLPYERVAIASLKLDPKNARKHDRKNIEAIKFSIKNFSQQKTIVVTKDNIVIAGNGTVMAFKELKDETGEEKWDTIDITRSQLTAKQAKAYALADNRTTDLSDFDDDILKETLQELKADEWDIEGLGWNDADLQALLDPVFEPNISDNDSESEIKHRMTVIFEDDTSLEELFIELRDRGFKVKI